MKQPSTEEAQRHPWLRSRLTVILPESDDGKFAEKVARFTPEREKDVCGTPTFTLRQHFVLARVSSAFGMTPLEMFGNCPPSSPTFLSILDDTYAAIERRDEVQVERCLRALEAAAAPTLCVVRSD